MRIPASIALVIFAAGVSGCSQQPSALSPSAPTAAASTLATVPQIRAHISDTALRALSGVRIEVLDGAAAGTSVVSDDHGYAYLTGVFDKTTRFQASKAGYETWTSTWGCSVDECPGIRNAAPWLSFSLRPLSPPLDLAGEYTMTIMADVSCPSLPSVARARSYPVTVSKRFRDGTADLIGYTADIHDDDVLSSMQRFGIGVAGDYMSIFFRRGEGERPGLIERVADNTYVILTASARGTVNEGTTVALEFDGSLEYVTTRSPLTGSDTEQILAESRAACEAGNRLMLVRR